MKIEDVVFPLPLKQVGGCIEVDAPRTKIRKRLNWKKETWVAYRLSFSLNCEEIPRCPTSLKEGIILHSCDNQWCVDPDHLSIGTQKRNAKERVERHPTWRANVSKGIKLSWDRLTEKERAHKLRGWLRSHKELSRENHSGRFRRNAL